MRIKHPRWREPRTITKFALFPVTANHETRWLEKVTINQEYRPDLCFFGWHNDEFVDGKECEP